MDSASDAARDFASPRRRRLLEALLLLAAAALYDGILHLPASRIAAAGEFPATYRPLAGETLPSPSLLPVDDAYIFIRYAQQAARGRPFEWSPGEPSTGASSFAFPWLLVPGQWLADDLDGWSRWSRLVGVAGLWLAGLAAARLLRAVPLAQPWPLVAGLALVWHGPLAFYSASGMESGWAAAALLWALALWLESAGGAEGAAPRGSGRVARLAIAAGLLPWLRPEHAALSLAAAAALAAGARGARGRRLVPLALLPGLLLAALDWRLTGTLAPTGVVTKSALGMAYPEPARLAAAVVENLRAILAPIYAGLRPRLLLPPLGLMALATAAAALLPRRRAGPTLARLRPLAVAWLVLLALAPLSTHLFWQEARHHHPALACALVLAVAGVGVAVERARRPPARWRLAFLALPAAQLLVVPFWTVKHGEQVLALHRRHGVAMAWLEAHRDGGPLLVNDAGLPALAWDGEAIDLLGLGTSQLARPLRHGAGALAESLARRPRRPTLAAANRRVFLLPELLGEPLAPIADPELQTVVARVRGELLARTAASRPGIDFAHLPDEAGVALRWRPPPLSRLASLALVRDDRFGPSLQGCRPLRGRLGVPLAGAGDALVLRAAPAIDEPARLVVGFGDARGPTAPPVPVVHELAPGRWTEIPLAAPAASHLWLAAQPGALPCVEALSGP